MRRVLFALALSLSTAPAFAGGINMDFPHLTFPNDSQTTTSTKGCDTAPTASVTVCK